MAVRCDQHSVRFGQRASSQTVATPLADTTRRVAASSPPSGNGFFNQAGSRRRGRAGSAGRTGNDLKTISIVHRLATREPRGNAG
ncbi:MAG: hypothetical protein AMXMBFR83_29260 [Phycisphaerae bacterium]